MFGAGWTGQLLRGGCHLHVDITFSHLRKQIQDVASYFTGVKRNPCKDFKDTPGRDVGVVLYARSCMVNMVFMHPL